MSRPLLAFASLALLVSTLGATLARAATSPFDRPTAPTPHEVGWVCLSVTDTRITQVSSFNKDAPSLSVWVTHERFHVELEGDGPQGRICIPALVKVGTEDVPDNTLVFERVVVNGKVERPAMAELVLVPELETLAEATVRLTGTADQWVQAGGVWTFNASQVAVFPPKVVRGLPGQGEGPDPSQVFRGAAAIERFAEGCQPFELTSDAVGNLGVRDRTTGLVAPRGIEPFRLKQGTVVSRCEGLSTDGTMVALAERLERDQIGWFVVPRETEMRPLEDKLRFTADAPLGGYHVCRTPTWTSALLEEVELAAKWELLPSGEWRWLSGEHRDRGVLPPGMPVILLDHRDGWALVRVVIAGAPRILALPGRVVAVPSGPASEVRSLVGGLCQWPQGEWRAVAVNTRAFRVAQDAPGAELAGLWVELPQGTRVLSLCQASKGCDPIRVGGAQVSETERVVLVRFAGQLLGVRESDLRDRVTGRFDLRRERNAYWPGDKGVLQRRPTSWALGIGPGGRLSFVRQDDFAWTAHLRLQDISPGWGFEGGIGLGGDGHGTFMQLTAGAGQLLYAIEDAHLEFRGAVLGKLDLRFADGGGIGVDVIAKGQMRWVNDYAPVSLEIGVNLGFGGTFGKDGKSGVTFGMPLSLNIELIEF
ncbi:MAG: hypothetical protein CVU56_09250 [Deltaproteobacteria bacterium HGW-Deltaproteobacteria-14]|nr:MAG: hypothetical protein CVU56_09250 [Deltaproteobacteria bacterium HGW-Deltaproteobacteria-14]